MCYLLQVECKKSHLHVFNFNYKNLFENFTDKQVFIGLAEAALIIIGSHKRCFFPHFFFQTKNHSNKNKIDEILPSYVEYFT